MKTERFELFEALHYASILPENISLKLSDGEAGIFVFVDEEYLDPLLSIKILPKSPEGFNWGYPGSGPAQLAFAILLLYLPVNFAVRFYQKFKFDFIAKVTAREYEMEIPLKHWLQEAIISRLSDLLRKESNIG